MAKEGFGRARTWNSRLDSRKLACNSMTGIVWLASTDQWVSWRRSLSQSAGVNGSI